MACLVSSFTLYLTDSLPPAVVSHCEVQNLWLIAKFILLFSLFRPAITSCNNLLTTLIFYTAHFVLKHAYIWRVNSKLATRSVLLAGIWTWRHVDKNCIFECVKYDCIWWTYLLLYLRISIKCNDSEVVMMNCLLCIRSCFLLSKK